MEKKLEVKNLKISFRTTSGKVQAVRNISFDLYKGETFAIVGESGSGKSVTNRAVMGILAGNAIVESGEILYDGIDILKLPEEEMVKLRGNKISMIFQDPLSALDPIMRIGKQITEAMLLKNHSSRKNARGNFNSLLKNLNIRMDEGVDEETRKSNGEKCKTFDNFCVNSCHLESKYNAIHRSAEELKDEIDNTLFLLERKRSVDLKHAAHGVLKKIEGTYHPDIVVTSDKLQKALSVLSHFSSTSKAENAGNDEVVGAFKAVSEVLDEAVKRPEPNYFTLGYYMMRNPEANLDDMPIDELTAMTRKYLDDEFMLDFIAIGSEALKKAREESLGKKRLLLGKIDEAIKLFDIEGDLSDSVVPISYLGDDFNKKKAEMVATIKSLSVDVKKAINELEFVKNSIEYSFASSMGAALNTYFLAIKNNPKELARYNKQKAKYDSLIASGKTIDWKVVPAAIVDLNEQRDQIKLILLNLKANYERQLSVENYDYNSAMVAVIDYLKEQASAFVYKVTRKLAKAKALKLMEEVGIPEVRIRYNQYPFEFSGGMRQRIVIAIALATNPDILICDEPTTALDVTIQAQILELINKLKKERNLSVIFITHDLGVVANMADRIAVMYAGKIVETGTADDVFYDPRHPYTWALLSSMPDLDTDEKLDAIPGTPPNMIYPPKGDAFAARNKYAMQIDFEEEPPLFKVSDTHYAATWLLHPNAPKVEIPSIITNRIARMNEKSGGSEDGKQ